MLSSRSLLLAAALLAVPSSAQNLLVNANFEAGALSGWSTFGNAFPNSASPPRFVPRSGNELCAMYGNFSGGFNVTGIYQQVAATPGDQFTMDAWSRHWSGDALIGSGAPNDNWVVMKIAFFDANGTEIGAVEGTILDGNSPTDVWIDNAPIAGTAPAGTANAQALILFLQPGADPGAAHVDDISFTRSNGTNATIRIDTVPVYGTVGSITGTVTGVNFASYRVAPYLYVDGAGWFTKPSAANPTVAIQPDGTFTASVYTCCLDSRATVYRVDLVPNGVTPTLASGGCAVPATAYLATHSVERYGRTIEFAGRTWAVKDAPTAVGPGGNLFSDDANDVFVDPQGRLHLQVVNRSGQWWCSEVVLVDDVGYGTYWFTTESQVGFLDANITFGAFTWDPHCDDITIPTWPNREIDFEDSRWGSPGDPQTSQVVIQPYSTPGNLIRYTTPFLSPATLTRYFTWTPTRVDFGAVTGRESPCSPGGTTLHASSYFHDPGAGRFIPPAGRERFRFNLWINGGGAPSNLQTAEVIISDFRFSSSPGTFPGGCGINPTGSATILSGSPTLGNTITLGFDNPAGTQAPGSALVVLLGGGAPVAGFPCGLALPGWGMTGPAGELLVDPGSPLIVVPGGTWTGAGTPVPFPIAIPNDGSLVDVPLFAQGVLADIGGATPLGLTDAFEMCIRN